MLWMELTSNQLKDAVVETGGVCLLPIGCIERHGAHLPLGTDQIVVDEVARRAAEIEPAVVFASYYLGKIFTARHSPGAIALNRNLLFPVLEAIVEEIARNGFKKILIVNGHGGNTTMLAFFVRTLLDTRRDYAAYVTDGYVLDPKDEQRWEEMRETTYGGHGGERETSVVMAVRPDLVATEAITPPKDGQPRGAQAGLEGMENPLIWYANHPTHYAGDARAATAEKGEFLVNAFVQRLARMIRAVKSDSVTAGLLQEFYDRSDNPDA